MWWAWERALCLLKRRKEGRGWCELLLDPCQGGGKMLDRTFGVGLQYLRHWTGNLLCTYGATCRLSHISCYRAT
jgi:hypothetical protein